MITHAEDKLWLYTQKNISANGFTRNFDTCYKHCQQLTLLT